MRLFHRPFLQATPIDYLAGAIVHHVAQLANRYEAIRDSYKELTLIPGSYRLSLQGSALTVDIDEAGDEDANSAWKMASRYVDALRRCGVPIVRLMTFAELGAMPPALLTSHTQTIASANGSPVAYGWPVTSSWLSQRATRPMLRLQVVGESPDSGSVSCSRRARCYVEAVRR